MTRVRAIPKRYPVKKRVGKNHSWIHHAIEGKLASDEVPVRLILGVDAEKRMQQAEAARAAEAEKCRHLTASTVFEDGRSVRTLTHHDLLSEETRV